MHIFTKYILILLVFALFYSCDSVGPDKKIPSTQMDLSHLWIAQHDYNSLSIGFPLDKPLNNDDVTSIVFSERVGDDSTESQIVDSVEAVYFETDGSYSLVFTFVRIVPIDLLYYDFTLRYNLADGSVIEIDTLFPLYKYPYEETELFIDTGTKFQGLQSIDFLSDIDIANNRLYFCSGDSRSIGVYNWETDELSWLVSNRSSGRYIAVSDTAYIFFEYARTGLARYNMTSGIVDLKLSFWDILPNEYPSISGLDVVGDKLFVAVNASPDDYLYTFDTDYNILDSLLFVDISLGHMTIKDEILYYNDHTNKSISRFDLATHLSLAPYKLPGAGVIALKIVGDDLYFTDRPREFVGVVPLSALK